MSLYKLSAYTIATIALMSCKPKFDVPDPDKGNIDASNYLALGGSMTAGYSNGALYHEAQQNSYAYLLAEQLKLVGSGEFKVPYVPESSMGVGTASNSPSVLGDRTDCQGTVSLGPVKLATQGDISLFTTSVYASQGPFNNLGVPDVKVIDMDVPGYGKFYSRMASSPSSSILSDAVAKNPTFFTVALGLNDVLDFALKGATADAITPVGGGVNAGFEASMNNIIDKLTANGAKGVIANIPSIKSMAYFNTIPWDGLKLDAQKATDLTAQYAPLDSTKFYEGNNGFIIQDTANHFLGYRQAVQGEYILLNVPLDSVKCWGLGSLNPIPDRYSLTRAEVDMIENAINNYNSILKNIANSKGLAFVDTHAFFEKVKTGFMYNGVSVSAAFVSGGAYSLDGLNLTPRGNALLANEFIKAINETYQSSIPHIDATKYPGSVFP